MLDQEMSFKSVKNWLPSNKQEQLFQMTGQILGRGMETTLNVPEHPSLRQYSQHFSNYLFPINLIRLNRVRDQTFSDPPSVYLPLGSGICYFGDSIQAFGSGDLLIKEIDGEINFKTEGKDFYLVSFLGLSTIESLAPELLSQIGSRLDNPSLRELMGASKITASNIYVAPNEAKLRQCDVYGKPIEYWETFIRYGSPYPECYQYFLDRVDDSATRSSLIHFGNDFAFWIAVFKEYFESAEYLLSQGVDIHANNERALLASVNTGSLKAVKFLIDHGADVNAPNGLPLRTAAEKGDLEKVKVLVDNGADIHVNDDDVLIRSYDNEDLEIVEYLISRGANVRAQNSVMIMSAAEKGDSEMMKYLISQGANVHAEDNYAIVAAAKAGSLEIIKLLVSAGLNNPDRIDGALVFANARKHIDMVNYLKSIGGRYSEFYVEYMNNSGRPLL